MSDEIDAEVEKAMASGTELSVLVAEAVENMISGYCEGVKVEMGLGGSFDPCKRYAYGDQLLQRCVKELQKPKGGA